MHRERLILGCVLLIAAGLAAAATEFNAPARQPPAAAIATERVIVKLRNAAPAGAAQAKAMADAMSALTARTSLVMKSSQAITAGMHVMEFKPQVSGETLAQSLARLRADPAVEYAEPDERRFAHETPNDLGFGAQWYMQNPPNAPSAVNAAAAWDNVKGSSSLVIAVLDTGARFEHEDLLRAVSGGRLLDGYDFISDADVAHDSDAGRDADASDTGDFVNADDVATAKFSGCKVGSSSWHGTRVAGIIGALSNNSKGVAGMTWVGSILPVRVLGKCGGRDSDILAAMLWAGGISVNGIPPNPKPAQIENLSLGAIGGSCPATYRDVVSQLAARGVLVVVSAGNESGAVDVPANCPGVAGIGAVRHVGTKVGFSNLGPEVAVTAPGGNCVNVGAGQPCLFSIDTTTNFGTSIPLEDGYTDQINFNVGTSFSAPIVSGIAGLMLAANARLSAAQLIARLKEGANKNFPVSSDAGILRCAIGATTQECSCTSHTCGAGLANALGSVNAALRPIANITVPPTVTAGQNVMLQASGSTAAGSRTIMAFNWVASGATPVPNVAGATTPTATVVAPTTGSYTVRLTVTDGQNFTDCADVTITPTSATRVALRSDGTSGCQPPAVDVAIAPQSAAPLAGSGTQSFVGTVVNNPNTAVTWQVNGVTGGNATVGTISTQGLYTAPAAVPAPALVIVSAVSAADTNRSDSAQVTIGAPVVQPPPPPPPPPPTPTPTSGGGGSLDFASLMMLVGLMLARPVLARVRQ